MGRRLAVPCALATLLVFVPASAAKAPGSWAQPQIQAVVGAGIMGTDVASFHPDGPLTRIALEQLVAGLTHTAPALVANPTATVTITNLDARLVNALALNDTAKLFQQSAAGAGLTPPSRFGTEAVARLLGLRTNHPASQDNLELLPNQVSTRAEAAFSGAQILKLSNWEIPGVQGAAATFTLPAFTPWQQRILQRPCASSGTRTCGVGRARSRRRRSA